MKYLNRKGLSFVEVVVSTLILSLIMAAFFGLDIFFSDTMALAHHKIIAMYWAQAYIDAERADLFGHIAGFDDPSNMTFLAVALPNGKGGERRVEPSTVFNADGSLKHVAVQILWKE